MSMVGRSVAALSPPSLPDRHSAAMPAVSCGEFPAPRAVDLHRFRTVFPNRWAKLLRTHFRSLLEVQVFFGVSERTARDWLSGTTGPAGAFVVIACQAIPGAADELMAAAA